MNRAFAYLIFTILALFSLEIYAQTEHTAPSIEFVKNHGQWDEKIQFESSLPGGDLYIENGKLTFVFFSGEDMDRIHELKHSKAGTAKSEDLVVRGHLFQVSFPGSNEMAFSGKKKKSNYYNYFQGNDPAFWAGKVPAYREAVASDVWDGIDYRLYSQNIDLKYDFIVHPNADVSDIQLRFDHLDKLYLKNGNLHLKTSVNELIDMEPLAYQKLDGEYKRVKCNYSLKRGLVTFDFPEGYDKSTDLIIDPKLIFSSYTGSTKDNWGFTATFDQAGNLYGGGIVRYSGPSTSYPTTTGAFQTNFGGGEIDIGISKFSANGTSLIYSTYLGGSQNEIPHSLVVNSSNQLIVMGTTSSPNYPTTSNAYDNTYNITGSVSATVGQIFPYIGSDIVLSKFSAGGDSLLGSTFVGGTNFDGINKSGFLEYNYGDDVRGEVVLDNSDNILVASTTYSTNFPVTNFSTFAGGNQDAVVFKMNSSLTNMIWATYLGGSGVDAAYSVQVDDVGRTFVAGGTTSSNFPTTAGAIHPNNMGGTDGFVSVINPSGFGIIASTYLGTSSYDQAYFVQLDDSNHVFVTGQTEGQYLVTPSTVYVNPNSAQFIHKLSTGLDSTIFSTVVGTGGSPSNITVDISPSAFLVNQCDHIYLSGWGGTINNYGQPNNSTTTGLPTTAGAYKTTTDGNDFYLIVLNKNADSLLYATFFGGSNANGEHVDGGTSRFDKRGIVYQAVCAGCGGNSSFPTAPSNVWSSTNGSFNCNLGVIKFDLSQLSSDVALNALPKVCVPGTVAFTNNSNGGTNFFWDFGDGDTSTLFQPVHTYLDTGNFTVMLVVSDSLSCLLTDTSYIVIRGDAPPIADILPIPVLCPGDSVQLFASGGIKYKWTPNTFISNDTINNPFVYPLSNTNYVVIVGDSCGSDTSNYFAYDTANVNVIVAQDVSSIMESDTICKGDSIQLSAGGGVFYNWTPSGYLSNPNIYNPFSSPPSTTNYSVVVTDQFGCPWGQNVTIYVEDPQSPNLISSPDTFLCKGDSIVLFVLGGSHYMWSPGRFTQDSTSSRTYVSPDKSVDFYIDVINKCFTVTDTIHVDVIDFVVEAMPDTFACEDVPILLTAKPGVSFEWTPTDRLVNPESNTPKALIKEEQTFYVHATDEYGCTSDDSLFMGLRNAPYINAGGDRVVQGNSVILEVKGNGKFIWKPQELVKCPTCRSTEALVLGANQLFTVKITDEFGCVNSDQVLISKITHSLYIPNTFSPNSDRKNDAFRAYGFNIDEFEMTIYNRWGEVIFVSNDLEYGWNGTYDGRPVQSGTYVWVVKYRSGQEETEKKGSVTLLK